MANQEGKFIATSMYSDTVLRRGKEWKSLEACVEHNFKRTESMYVVIN
jgi:hypothetical protein